VEEDFKGGGDQTIDCKFTDTPNTSGYYTLTLKDIDLFFTKKGVLIQGDPSQKFEITLRVSDIKSLFQKNLSRSLFEVTFTRNNKNSKGQPIKHRITILSYFTNPENQVNTIAMIMNPKAEYVTTYYNFSDDKQKRNQTFFKDIQTCIITKLIEELNKLKVLLDGCKIRIFSLSFEDAREYLKKAVGDKCLNNGNTSLLKILNHNGGLFKEETFLSFFDCIYVNSSRDIDEDKTHKEVPFIPFNRFGIFTSYVNERLTYSNELMKSLRTLLQQRMTEISNTIEQLKTYDQHGEYINMDTLLENLEYLVQDNMCIGFAYKINNCPKIDEKLAKFVIEKSKDKADNAEYRDYDGAVKYIPPDLLSPSTASV